MAWTAPMTAVDGAIFTASQFNANIRDNFLETAPAKATTEGGYFTVNGLNSIVQRLPGSANIDALQTTLSTTFTDLATVGPTVTVNTGTRALVVIGSSLTNGMADGFSIMGVTISGLLVLPLLMLSLLISSRQGQISARLSRHPGLKCILL